MSTFGTFTALGHGINELANRVQVWSENDTHPTKNSWEYPPVKVQHLFLWLFFSLLRKRVSLFVRHRKLFLQIISLINQRTLPPLFLHFFLAILWPQTWPAGRDGSSWHLFEFDKIKRTRLAYFARVRVEQR